MESQIVGILKEADSRVTVNENLAQEVGPTGATTRISNYVSYTPGKPNQNIFIERFNRSYEERPHDVPGSLAPAMFHELAYREELYF